MKVKTMGKRKSNRNPVAVTETVEPVTVETETVETVDTGSMQLTVNSDGFVTDARIVEPVEPVDDTATVEPVAPVEPTIIEIIANVETDATDEKWFRHRETRHGIPVPKGYGLCARAWYLFDDLFAKGIIDTATIVAIGTVSHGLNAGNLRTEISRYRKYHGIARAGTARPVTVATVATVEPVTE